MLSEHSQMMHMMSRMIPVCIHSALVQCFHGAFWYSKCLRLLQSQQDAHSMSPLKWNNLSTPFWRSSDPASCNIFCAMPATAKRCLKCFICDLLSTTTKRFGKISIEQEWMYILESCSSILEPCWLKKGNPQKTLNIWFIKRPIGPFWGWNFWIPKLEMCLAGTKNDVHLADAQQGL